MDALLHHRLFSLSIIMLLRVKFISFLIHVSLSLLPVARRLVPPSTLPPPHPRFCCRLIPLLTWWYDTLYTLLAHCITREKAQGLSLKGIGHRVVHGGLKYAQPVRMDNAVLKEVASKNW